MNILIGVTGGIAAYKVCDIINMLKTKYNIKVVMTENATKFISPMTLEALSGNKVLTTMWDSQEKISHIELTQNWADIFLVAPATANILAKFALGIADDLLSTMFLAARIPTFIAPAMNTNMYRHPAVQDNILILESFNSWSHSLEEDELEIYFIKPIEKKLACNVVGVGAMAKPKTIVKEIEDYIVGEGNYARENR